MKSRLAEILGVEEDQEFLYKYGKYRIHNGLRQHWNSGGWYISGNECGLVEIINHPEKINRLPRWTEQDVEDAKAIKRVFKNAYEAERSADSRAVFIRSTQNWIDSVAEYLLPSLEINEKVKLDEIIGGAE